MSPTTTWCRAGTSSSPRARCSKKGFGSDRRRGLLAPAPADASAIRIGSGRMKLGLNLGYWGIGPRGDEALEAVRAAESAGFDSVWVAESYGSDVVSVLAWLAPQTE